MTPDRHLTTETLSNCSPSRRDFLVVASGLVGIAASRWFVPVVAASETSFQWQTLSHRARVAMGAGGNALVVSRGAEALLVDTKIHGFGPVLRREITAFGLTVRTVINTHHHGDHTGGNTAFAPRAITIAHARAKQRSIDAARATLPRLAGARADSYADALRGLGLDVRLTPDARADVDAFIREVGSIDPAGFAPTETFDVQREVRAAGFIVQLHYVGPAHTDNDAIVHIPELNLLHTGDLLFHGYHPFIDVDVGASTSGWDRCLAAALRLCTAETIVVAGHGSTTDRHGLQQQRDYFDRLREVVVRAIRQERSRAEIVEMKPEGFRNLGWPDGLSANLGVLYDELTKPKR